jgi:hypothetical protein
MTAIEGSTWTVVVLSCPSLGCRDDTLNLFDSCRLLHSLQKAPKRNFLVKWKTFKLEIVKWTPSRQVTPNREHVHRYVYIDI